MTHVNPLSIGMIAAFLGSGSLLAGAYAFQYFGGLAPCDLCLWQRWPHWALVVLGLVGLFLLRQLAKTGPALMWLAAALALTSAGLAFYHVGVEQQWWLGPQGCTARPVTGSLEDIMKGVVQAPFVPCDKIPWEMFGISMAGYNFLFSLLLLGVFLWSVKGVRHGK